MSHTDARLPSLDEALVCVGNGTGFGSLSVRNGRSRIGHIRCQKAGGALCGVDKRMAAHFDTDCDNDDEEFSAWLKLNWELGICRSCLHTLPTLRRAMD